MHQTIYFATSNMNKVREIKEALLPHGVDVKHIELNLPEIQSDRLESVAEFKAREAYKLIGHAVMVEDAGLFINTLKGFPGVYSSYVYRTIGVRGILKLMEGVEDRTAKFRAVIALALNENDIRLFAGECPGKIAEEVKGIAGFGFDPIFIPEGHNRTFAEDYEYKRKVSHRRKAIEALAIFIQNGEMF